VEHGEPLAEGGDLLLEDDEQREQRARVSRIS
jgi:hypothetical protein